MRAFVIRSAGADAIECAELPVPQVGADEFLVRVCAIGVGIHDSYFLPAGIEYPFPIGIEAAGIVDEVGAEVADRSPGERVAFVSAMQPKGGTWAEYAVVDGGALVVPIPARMGFAEAATVPVAGNTALRAIDALGAAPTGGTLFVAGGSGAIGTFAIQLARQRGWRVGASASERNHDYLRGLGAESVVDYRETGWAEQVRRWAQGGVDAAIAVQPGTTAQVLAAVRDGGGLISISGDQVASERGVRVATVPHQSDVRDELAELMEQVAGGAVHAEIERVYPFEQAPEALARVQTRHTRGKIVLTLAEH